jgi:hypothetical protein
MKKLNLLFSISFLTIIISCHDQKSDNKIITHSDTLKKEPTTSSKITDQQTVDDLANFFDLTPLEIKDSLNKNVFEKYGIEFNGNCYACDLAKINITKKHFDFINVCNEKVLYRIENFSYSTEDITFIVKTPKNEFHFTKIDEAPVYKLEVKGDKINLKETKLPIYFTNKEKLNKFKEHDCGDFQG